MQIQGSYRVYINFSRCISELCLVDFECLYRIDGLTEARVLNDCLIVPLCLLDVNRVRVRIKHHVEALRFVRVRRVEQEVVFETARDG